MIRFWLSITYSLLAMKCGNMQLIAVGVLAATSLTDAVIQVSTKLHLDELF